MYIKHKRSITAIILIFIAMLFVSADKKRIDIRKMLYSNYNFEIYSSTIEEFIEDEVTFVSMTLGRGYLKEEYNVEDDDLEKLFSKFEVRYELQDYIRQLCEIYNVPNTLAVSVSQIETHNGKIKDYDVRAEYRMYYTWDKETETYVKTWDLGYFQLNSSLTDYWEECFFNPELIFSLGYVRDNYDITDDMINIQIGIAYIDYLLKYYHGDQPKAIMAFNTGMGNVNKGKIPDMTIAYEHAISRNWKYRERDV